MAPVDDVHTVPRARRDTRSRVCDGGGRESTKDCAIGDLSNDEGASKTGAGHEAYKYVREASIQKGRRG